MQNLAEISFQVKDHEDRLDDHEKRIMDIEKGNVKLGVLMDQTIENSKETTKFIKSCTDTLINLQRDSKDHSKQIANLNNSVKSEESRGKIDFLKWLSQNWILIVLSLTLAFFAIKDYIIR